MRTNAEFDTIMDMFQIPLSTYFLHLLSPIKVELEFELEKRRLNSILELALALELFHCPLSTYFLHFRYLVLLAAAACVLCLRADTRPVIRTVAELTQTLFVTETDSINFDLDVVLTDADTFTVEDGTGDIQICGPADRQHLRTGDRLQLSGHTLITANHDALAYCKSIKVLGHGEPPPPVDVSGRDFVSGRFDFRRVRLKGTLADVLTDDVDARAFFLALDADGERIVVPYSRTAYECQRDVLRPGAKLVVTGICNATPHMSRRHIGRIMGSAALTVVKESADDIFNADEIDRLMRLQPSELSRLGRHRATGIVLATWNGRSALLRTDKGELVQADFVRPPLPVAGESVDVVGFPETDLYTFVLTRAEWRPAARPVAMDASFCTTNATSVRALFADAHGRPRFDGSLLGQTVVVRGTVRTQPAPVGNDRTILVESEGYTVPVDVTAGGDAPLDATVEVTATCVFTTERWRPNNIFPSIRGLLLVTRTPADLRIVARPPWWTRGRLAAALAALAALFVGIVVWNFALRRLAERRGRDLAAENLARAEAEMRTLERTRLAVELHDSLAQNLTGVAMEIETAAQFLDDVPPALRQHLGIAEKALDSCRTDLRNCLFDLRNDALEEPDAETAIRRTLAPHLKGAELALRFRVPRERISDNTMHVLLRIIRELVLNALRHGHATHLRVAGSVEDDKLLFSVTDDGCGFDPANPPGVLQGHFGLQGIRERLRPLDGTLAFESTPGHTKATVRLHMPQGES